MGGKAFWIISFQLFRRILRKNGVYFDVEKEPFYRIPSLTKKINKHRNKAKNSNFFRLIINVPTQNFLENINILNISFTIPSSLSVDCKTFVIFYFQLLVLYPLIIAPTRLRSLTILFMIFSSLHKKHDDCYLGNVT